MSGINHQVMFSALGFLAVVMKGDAIPKSEAAQRAKDFAKLIDMFCRDQMPDALGMKPTTIAGEANDNPLDRAIDHFKTALKNEGEAHLPESRDSLLQFYDRLLIRKARREQYAFYATGKADLIANRILRMVDEEIEQDESGTRGNA